MYAKVLQRRRISFAHRLLRALLAHSVAQLRCEHRTVHTQVRAKFVIKNLVCEKLNYIFNNCISICSQLEIAVDTRAML